MAETFLVASRSAFTLVVIQASPVAFAASSTFPSCRFRFRHSFLRRGEHRDREAGEQCNDWQFVIHEAPPFEALALVAKMHVLRELFAAFFPPADNTRRVASALLNKKVSEDQSEPDWRTTISRTTLMMSSMKSASPGIRTTTSPDPRTDSVDRHSMPDWGIARTRQSRLSTLNALAAPAMRAQAGLTVIRFSGCRVPACYVLPGCAALDAHRALGHWDAHCHSGYCFFCHS